MEYDDSKYDSLNQNGAQAKTEQMQSIPIRKQSGLKVKKQVSFEDPILVDFKANEA